MDKPEKIDFIYIAVQLIIILWLANWLISNAWPDNQKITPIPATKATAPVPAQLPVTPVSEPAPSQTVSFSNIRLNAESAIVYDITTGEVIYDRHAYEKRPIASITKVMTTYVASRLLPENTEVIVDTTDAELPSSAGIIAGERWSLSDLTAFTLVSSSNGGAQAIARAVNEYTGKDSITEMNNLAKEMGLNDTLFRNETGLDLYNGQLSGSYSTAADIAKLFARIMGDNPDLLKSTRKNQITVYSLDKTRHQAFNTDYLLAKVPNILASKTGTTDLAGGNLALVVIPKNYHPVAIVVLGSTAQGRFTDASKLIMATENMVANK